MTYRNAYNIFEDEDEVNNELERVKTFIDYQFAEFGTGLIAYVRRTNNNEYTIYSANGEPMQTVAAHDEASYIIKSNDFIEVALH